MTRIAPILAAVLLTIMFAIEVSTSFSESQSWDEGVHLAAGASYWMTADFRMNPEHPPLMKVLNAFPVVLAGARLPTEHPSWSATDEWKFGDVFLYQNRFSAQTLLLLGRLPTMVLSIILGIVIYGAARNMFGPWGGTLSVALYSLDPSIISHSRYVTTDLGFTAFSFFTMFRLVKLLSDPSRHNALWFGALFLATGLAKFSGMVFAIALIGTFIVLKWREPHHQALAGKTIRRALLIGLPTAAFITWSVYGFAVRAPAHDPRISQLYSQREEVLATTDVATLPWYEQFAVNVLGDQSKPVGHLLHQLTSVPIPGYPFFRGMFAVIGHSLGGQGSYLLGHYSNEGFRYYFPIAFVAKTPLPTFAAMVLAGGVFLFMALSLYKKMPWREVVCHFDRQWLVYGIPPIIFFLMSLLSNLNLGWRHIMPIYPPLVVLVGSLVTLPKFWKTLVPATVIAGLIVIQLRVYPNEMSYFSSIVGGTENGPHVLLDSNLDWGQDLPKLAQFVTTSKITSLPFAYNGRTPVEYYVPQVTRLPTTEEVKQNGAPQGIIGISFGQLFREDHAYSWLHDKTPLRTIGSSMYIYNLK